MNKIYSILILTLLATITLSASTLQHEKPVQSISTQNIGGIDYQLDDATLTASVTGCTASLTDLNIPSSVTNAGATYTVTTVTADAFKNNSTITSITFPSTITTIDTDAFHNSSPKTIYITDLAAWCAVEFANGNANPIYRLFSNSNQSRWGKLYIEGTQLTNTLVIPEGVTTIGRSFYGLRPLVNLSLPNSLRSLGDQCFANSSIEEVEIPEAVESIGSAFFSCSSLKKVTLKGTVKTLGSNTFYSCSDLLTINLPEGLETIGNMTFSGCSSLENIELPSTLQSIGMMAFDGCKAIANLHCAATVPPTAADYAFDGIDTAIPVYVPSSIDTYKAAPCWEEFTNYVADNSGIDAIESDTEMPALFYTTSGMRVDNPGPGLYIVRRGTKTSKILIK